MVILVEQLTPPSKIIVKHTYQKQDYKLIFGVYLDTKVEEDDGIF
jgi:hypothetical protein